MERYARSRWRWRGGFLIRWIDGPDVVGLLFAGGGGVDVGSGLAVEQCLEAGILADPLDLHVAGLVGALDAETDDVACCQVGEVRGTQPTSRQFSCPRQRAPRWCTDRRSMRTGRSSVASSRTCGDDRVRRSPGLLLIAGDGVRRSGWGVLRFVRGLRGGGLPGSVEPPGRGHQGWGGFGWSCGTGWVRLVLLTGSEGSAVGRGRCRRAIGTLPLSPAVVEGDLRTSREIPVEGA